MMKNDVMMMMMIMIMIDDPNDDDDGGNICSDNLGKHFCRLFKGRSEAFQLIADAAAQERVLLGDLSVCVCYVWTYAVRWCVDFMCGIELIVCKVTSYAKCGVV